MGIKPLVGKHNVILCFGMGSAPSPEEIAQRWERNPFYAFLFCIEK